MTNYSQTATLRAMLDAMRSVMIQINARLRQYQRAIEKHHMIK